MKFKAVTMETYGGCYGIGNSPQEAWDNLMSAMKKDGARWESVQSFVIVAWNEQPDQDMNERVVLGFGALRREPEKRISESSAKRKKAVANAVTAISQ